MSPLSDTHTGNHGTLVGAALLSGWNCLCQKMVLENGKPPGRGSGYRGEQGLCVGSSVPGFPGQGLEVKQIVVGRWLGNKQPQSPDGHVPAL